MNEFAVQYRIIAAGVGWIDKRARGRLRLEGRDAVGFLHALVTNDVLALGPGRGVYAAYLTPQGRMKADLTIHHCGDHVLADVAPGLADRLARDFDQLIFTEDVRVSDVSASLAQIGVAGPTAASILAHAFGLDPLAPEKLTALPVLSHLQSGEATIVRTDEFTLPSFDVFLRADRFGPAVERLAEMGAVAIAPDLADALRIEAGRPAFGVDMTEDTIPLEAGLLDRAISLAKGCYVGQEVIVRVLHRGGGRVARRLVRLSFDDALDAPPEAGTALFDAGRDVGRITSAARSPAGGAVAALGYVHRDSAEEGRRLVARVGAADRGVRITGFAG